MKDHYRPQKMALWMNLIPDLQSAAIASSQTAASDQNTILKASRNGFDSLNEDEAMLDYRLYNELLPFVPKLKNLDSKTLNRGSTPASSEVLDLLGRGNTTPHEQAMASDSKNIRSNSSYIVQQDSSMVSGEGLTSYSTALSVTIAIGCSLLVLNVLIFTAVYYQRDRHRDRHTNKLDTSILTCNSLSEGSGPPGSAVHHGASGGLGPRNRSLDGGMTSISQYIERRPSDCMIGTPPSQNRRSLQDMTLPAPPPPASMVTTVSVGGGLAGGQPRKSALKSSCSKGIEGIPSTFRTHLPPPEFADQCPTSVSGGGGNRHLTMAESHIPSHSSFRTLPSRTTASGVAQSPQVPPHHGSPAGHHPINSLTSNPLAVPPHQHPHHSSSQTLPLKSNLKKTNQMSAKNTLQWSATTVTSSPATGTSGPQVGQRVSLEELRV